jgi:hypothetical protein
VPFHVKAWFINIVAKPVKENAAAFWRRLVAATSNERLKSIWRGKWPFVNGL